MKNILKTIFTWIKKAFLWMFSDWKNLVIVVSLITLLFLYFNYRSEKKKLENIIVEQTDTLTTYKNKVGELYSEKAAYITDIKNLKQSNSDLYAEVKKLKDNPIVITKIETVTEIKEIYIKDSINVIEPGVYSTGINYNDKWCGIFGETRFDTSKLVSETKFDSIRFYNNITIDLIESKKGNLSFIAKSDNPYCQINNLNGVMLSPEDSKAIRKRYDKKWVLAIGVGPSVTVVDNTVKIYPSAQLTFGRKIFSF